MLNEASPISLCYMVIRFIIILIAIASPCFHSIVSIFCLIWHNMLYDLYRQAVARVKRPESRLQLPLWAERSDIYVHFYTTES